MKKISKGFFFDTNAEYLIWQQTLSFEVKQNWFFEIKVEPNGVRVLYSPNVEAKNKNRALSRAKLDHSL